MTNRGFHRRMLLAASAGLLASPAILRAQTAPRDLASTLSGNTDTARFAEIVERAGLGDRLRGTQPLTVFAPSAAAWQAVPSQLMQDLLGGGGQGSSASSADPVRLAALAGIHMLEGSRMSASLRDKMEDVRSVNGGLVRVDGRAVPMTVAVAAPEGGVRGNFQTGVGGFNVQPPAKVTMADIICSNGVIHVIDGVLLP
ncbi:fasciclin domain-containing protein [Humitalea sp. 24SJ18S-53]|uniref:fasciclin domain-containing protein n=1 Tax=Humitalea sp. 24SJ18S-53 TaxID=3422307 RepID=UPI003D66F6E8